MPDITKIATCSYCGTRTLIRLDRGERYELVCSACGAHLRELSVVGRSEPKPETRAPVEKPRSLLNRDYRSTEESRSKPNKKYREKRDKYRHKRKRRGLGYWIREAWDEIEDFFD